MVPSYSNKRWAIISCFTIAGQMSTLTRLHLYENVGGVAVGTIPHCCALGLSLLGQTEAKQPASAFRSALGSICTNGSSKR